MKVVTNTAVSVDGKIATARYDHVAIGTPTDRRYMSVLRARADAVLVGGRTFRNWPLPLVPDADAIARLRADGFPDTDHPDLAGRTWLNFVVTRTGNVPPYKREDPRARLHVVTGDVTVPALLADLAARGVETLLVEAGGDLLFQLFEADAVDDVYLTVCPLVVGGKDAPTFVDGRGFSAEHVKRMRLAHVHRVGDELYCRYTLRG